MRFIEQITPGAFVIEPERREDERGFFARVYCREEFARHGLNTTWAQESISFNKRRGTMRGMHFNAAPHEEEKLVRCTMGALWDVIIDLRPESPAFKRHVAVELSAENRRLLYIPKGFAHGFLTLGDNTEAHYMISEMYAAQAGRGVRWNDPAFGIQWPAEVRVIAERDAGYADFQAEASAK